ncbi:hypothetical protein PFISCL1PPCAC_16352, partial [Pristionchus fissidentatus]
VMFPNSRMKFLFFTLGLLATLALSQDVKITDAERTVDVTSQIAKINVALTVQNSGKSALSEVLFYVTSDEAAHLAHISSSIKKQTVKVQAQAAVQGFAVYKLVLPKKVEAGASETVNVEYVLVQSLVPFPEQITQDETQYVVYTGNAHISSPYSVDKQKTTVVFGSGKLQSFTNVAPSKQLGEKVVYGPYSNTAAKTFTEIRVHYENVSPFIVATTVERLIEISHWGNIAIEEKIQIVHKGAKLTGSFSRLDYQMDRRGKKQPCVKEFKTILPASARDIYYRDVIGNISSSGVKVRAESVEVEVKPRFPLFGGWKTNYVMGYNVPSYEYLYADGDKFVLNMRLLDHIYDGMVVEKLTTKIVLPEKASDVKLSTPYEVNRRPDEKLATYLDTEGRKVVVIEKTSLVDAHIKPFTLQYQWSRINIWREPLMASAFFFCLFLAVIAYVRCDFEITKDSASEALLGVQAKVEEVEKIVGQRIALHNKFIDAVSAFKGDKEEETLKSVRSNIEAERSELKKKMTGVMGQIKTMLPTASDKLNEIEHLEAGLVSSEAAYLEKTSKSTTKNSSEDRQWTARVNGDTTKMKEIINSI